MAGKKVPIEKKLAKCVLTLNGLKQLVQLGLTQKQIADIFGMPFGTLSAYYRDVKAQCPKEVADPDAWKKTADKEVEVALRKRALGYTFDEVTYEKVSTKPLKSTKVKLDLWKTKVTTKELPPDGTCMIFWLKNRQPAEWKDKREMDGNVNLTWANILHDALKPDPEKTASTKV